MPDLAITLPDFDPVGFSVDFDPTPKTLPLVAPPGHYRALPCVPAMRACTACPARQEARQVVVGDGPADAVGMVLGQNPGVDEDREGLPFIGAGGELLDAWLHALGLDRAKLVITNAVKCFPGETLAEAPDIERGYRHWYVGDLVYVATVDGSLAGTPNHPVLTDRGWLPLGVVQPGDNLVRGVVSQQVARRHPDVQGGPAQLRETFDALSQFGVRERVAGADVDFYGERPQAEVEVVSLDGLLPDRAEPEGTQFHFHHIFKSADGTPRLLLTDGTGGRDFEAVRAGLLAALGRGVRGGDKGVAVREVLPPVSQSVGPAATRYAVGRQHALDALLADVKVLPERPEASPLPVGFAQVERVERRSFTGHVYSLQAACGEFIANGFVVQNCHTTNNRVPRASELKACFEHTVSPELEALTALQVVFPVGKPAVSVLLGKAAPPMTPLAAHHYRVRVRSEGLARDLHVFPLPHPAFLLRARHLGPLMQTVLSHVRLTLEQEVPGAYALMKKVK